MIINIDRDSVCLGDDCLDHRKVYQMDDSATYEDLFQLIKQDDYLPHIDGNNVVWVLQSETIECILSYFTITDKMSPGLVEKSLQFLLKNTGASELNLHFKYDTTPLKWKEAILEMCKGDMYYVWHEGWLEEFNYCDKVMTPWNAEVFDKSSHG